MSNYRKITSLTSIRVLSRQTGKPVLSIIKALTDISCEKKIEHWLKRPPSLKHDQKLELYYRQKSRFAQIKILDHLKTKLMREGINAIFLTEFSTTISRYDIVVVVSDLKRSVGVEVKAGFVINLEQLNRYLWWGIPLILAQIPTGNVIKIDPSQLKPYILFSLKELEAKAERLLSGRIYTVPGFDCWSCTCFECPYNKGRFLNCLKRLSDEEFEADLMLFFRNLPYVAEKVARLVIEELKLPPRKQTSDREGVKGFDERYN